MTSMELGAWPGLLRHCRLTHGLILTWSKVWPTIYWCLSPEILKFLFDRFYFKKDRGFSPGKCQNRHPGTTRGWRLWWLWEVVRTVLQFEGAGWAVSRRRTQGLCRESGDGFLESYWREWWRIRGIWLDTIYRWLLLSLCLFTLNTYNENQQMILFILGPSQTLILKISCRRSRRYASRSLITVYVKIGTIVYSLSLIKKKREGTNFVFVKEKKYIIDTNNWRWNSWGMNV